MAKGQYLKPEVFQKHYDESLKKGEPTIELINDFKLIAENVYRIITKNVFHSDGDACKTYAVEEAWIKWKKYDAQRTTNIFAFFTQMIRNDIMTHYNYLNKGKGNIISMSLFEEGDDE